MESKIILLAMLAIAKTEEELMDDVILGITEFKADKAAGNKTTRPFAQMAALMLKFELGDRNPMEAIQYVHDKSKVAQTASEFHEMTDFDENA